MSFADGAFPLFLWAAVLACALLRAPSSERVWRWAQSLVFLCFGELAWVLALRPRTPMTTPVGRLLQHLAGAPWTTASVWRWPLGLGLFAFGVWAGSRTAMALDEDAAVRRAKRVGALLVAGTVAFVGAWLGGRLNTLAVVLATVGHPLWLLGWGAAWGAGLRLATRGVALQGALFLLSAVFYHAWAAAMPGAYRFLLGLIVATIVLDYFLARAIEAQEAPKPRKAMLVVSLVANLGVLVVFKYADFFGENLTALARHTVAPNAHWTMWSLILPAGISFHTFQSLSYTVDVYRRKLKPTASLVEFATFVLFFPQLVAGPIVRAEQFLPQIASPPAVDPVRATDGLARIVVGLVKKLCLADTLAVTLVDRVFANPGHFSAWENLFAVYGYAFQIYLDFSAYSDIAVGAASLLGFELPENFRAPYLAGDLSAFWRRWHISLSSWLRDYLYIPLGGSREGDLLTYRNLLATMVLGGLWHGAAWTFLVWGVLHGAGLAVTRAVQRRWAREVARPVRDVAVLATVAVVGALVHRAASPVLASLAARIGVDDAWAHLAVGWLYVAPAWAALGAWARLRGWRRAAALVTFQYVCFAWVFFRATSFGNARAVLAQLVTGDGDWANLPGAFALALGAAAVGHAVPAGVEARLRAGFAAVPWWGRAVLLVAAGVAVRALSRPTVVPFIYFQF